MPIEDGIFWLPDTPESTVRGEISYGPSLTPTVKLFGAITPAKKIVREYVDETGNAIRQLEPTDESEGFTLHGLLMETPRPVSLVDCSTIQRQELWGTDSGLESQTVTGRIMVRGSHVSGSNHKFSAAMIRVANIDEWANLPGFKISVGGSKPVVLQYEPSDLPSVATSLGVSVRMYEDVSRSWPKATGGHITRESWVRMDSGDPLAYAEWDMRYLTPVVSILNICIGQPSPVVAVEVQDGERWCEVWSSARREAPGRRISPIDVLAPLSLVGIETVANFVDLAPQIGAAGPIVADATGNVGASTLESQVLELTTVAEGLHRSLWDGEFRLTSADAERVRELVASALADEPQRHRQIVLGFLTHLEEPNYKSRLRSLALLAEELLPGVTGRTNRWVNMTNDARNSFAHRTEGSLSKADVDKYYAISKSLRWVLVAVLLIQVDVNTERCADWIRDNARYRQFRRNMKSAMPTVFDQ